MNGAMAAFAVLIAAAGALVFNARGHVKPKRKEACERAAAGLFGVAAFAFMVAFAPVLAVLWQETGTGAGLLVLALLFIGTAVFGYLMLIRGKGHHHHASIAVASLFGVVLALAIGGWHQISRSAGLAAASAGNAAGGVVSGSALTRHGGSTQQAVAAAATGGGKITLIVAAVVVVAALWMIARGYRKGSRGGAPRRVGRGRPGPSPIGSGGDL